jgi:hypothetical protein
LADEVYPTLYGAVANKAMQLGSYLGSNGVCS